MVKVITEKQAAGTEEPVNEVRLVGTLRTEPEVRVLPSGDELVTFRLSVQRPAAPGPGGQRSQTVDSVPCTVWSSRVRRSVMTWRPGDLVSVGGAVRCRFYQAGGATRSRVEVEVTAARVIRRSRAS